MVQKEKKQKAIKTKAEKLRNALAIFDICTTIAFFIAVGTTLYWGLVEISEVCYDATVYSLIVLVAALLTAILYTMEKRISASISEEEKNQEYEEKENIMQKLKNSEFKEIKIFESDDECFNAFIKASKLEAKIHDENDSIIMIRINFFEGKDFKYSKTTPFNRDYVESIIEEVIE